MEVNLDLTPNLKLAYIDENNCRDSKLIAVELQFVFFGCDAEAYLTVDSLDDERPSFGMTSSPSELHESFTSLIDENWSKIVPEVRKYVAQWYAYFEEEL
jgi:hypothetical protein